MCGSKYDCGRFNEQTQEWEFPRYLLNSNPADKWLNEKPRYPRGPLTERLSVHMWSARVWAGKLAFRAALPEISAAFAGGFVAEMEKEWIP